MARASVALPDYQEDILRSLRRIMRAVDLYSRRLVTDHGLSGPQLLCLRQPVETWLEYARLPSSARS